MGKRPMLQLSVLWFFFLMIYSSAVAKRVPACRLKMINTAIRNNEKRKIR
ncbi:hypothetical protein HanPSC8_Chr17g0791081 [Helianthus annuus]|nr:hypothetical protein HanIR_Chr17g0894001 [Helianthus annuus]KAJ0814891.1 hypothetical protein HanPSC8_Chr17g0791081 [Helianthus annuus]